MYFTHESGEWPVDSLTYTESVQPHMVTSTEGAVPSLSANVAFAHWANTYPLYRSDIDFKGKTHQVLEVGDSSMAKSVSALSRLERLNYDMVWPSMAQLSGLSTVGTKQGLSFSVSPSVTRKHRIPSALPALWGNAWLRLKELCAAFKIHTRGDDNVFYLNEERDTWDLSDGHVSSADVALSMSDVADVVHVASYEYGDFRNRTTEVFPKYSSSSDYSTISVDARMTEEVELPLDFALDPNQSIAQPVCQGFVHNREYTTPVYSVVGNDDLPIKPKQWADAGGSLQVFVKKDDPRTLVVRVRGANIPDLSPFTIAMSSGDSTFYNSLHVMARGVSIIRSVDTINTGVVNYGEALREAELDNPFVCSSTTIPNAFIDAARHYSGYGHTASITVPNEAVMPRVGDFIKYNGHIWRINTSTNNDGVTTTFSCTEHTRISDVNESLGTMTIKAFNDKFAGQKINEIDSRILL